jgi:hypothetical protein
MASEADLRLKKCFSAPRTATPRANMLVEVAAALVEENRAAETLGAVRPGRPGLSDGPGLAARAASPRPSLSSLQAAPMRGGGAALGLAAYVRDTWKGAAAGSSGLCRSFTSSESSI